jgi:tetratricopeptide (TPR) repeat protein
VPLDPQRTRFFEEAWIEHRPEPGQLAKKADRNLVILAEMLASGDDRAVTLCHLGLELLHSGCPEEAIAVLSAARAKAGRDELGYEIFCLLGDALLGVDEVERGLAAYGEALAVESTRAKAFLRLGMYFFERRKWRRAMPYFAALTVLERPSDSLGSLMDPAYSWLAWDLLAICSSELGQYRAALELTNRALGGHPEPERLMTNMRFYLQQINDGAEAADAPEWARRSRLVG